MKYIILLLLFIFLFLIGGYFYLAYFNSLPEVVVPDVTGLPLEAAREKLEESDLRARLAGSVYEMKYSEGAVVSQRPEGGRKVKVGRVVNLMVSSGRRKVVVPNLLGRPFSQADAVLSAVELQLGEVRQEKNIAVEEGTILAQEPVPGEEVGMGSSVDLLIATTSEVIVEEITEEVQ